MPSLRASNEPCPCRVREAVPRTYADCCGRWHAGYAHGEHAPEPEPLMRSRYTAYALLQGRGTGHRPLLGYLLDTWHPSTSPGELELGPLQWTGLEILAAAATAEAGVVEFVAHHKVGGRAGRLHETSRFVRDGGRWLYVDGVVDTGEAG